jgi:uncharacterized protein YbjT (DUF2867 family)
MQKLPRTYAVTGATGQIGRRLVRNLLAAGQKVRVLSRDAERAAALAASGAEVLVGAPDDRAYLARAFAGADAVLVLTPPHYGAADFRAYQNQVGAAVVAAIADAGVRKIVHLSSVGAQHAQGVGPVNGLHDVEQRLNALKGVDLVHLRPAYFLENLAFSLGLIKDAGIVGTPLRGDLRFPMIATRDIADRAAELLLALDFRGQSVQELLGERDLSMAELTQLTAQRSGRKLEYVQFPYDAAEQAMTQSGMSPDASRLMVELYRAVNEGHSAPVQPRSAASTTKTRAEDFVQEFVAQHLTV